MWSQLQVCKFPREQTEQEICKNVKAEFGYCNLPTCATVFYKNSFIFPNVHREGMVNELY